MKYTGKSYGSQAISFLAEKVFEDGYNKIIIRPAKNNIRAIKSYEKAGFKNASLILEDYYKPGFIEQYGAGDSGEGNDVFMVLE